MKKILLPTLFALITSSLPGLAQMGPPPSTVPAGLSKLFGNVTAFTAKCDVRVLDKNEKEKVSMPMEFALLDGKVRVELDMTQLKGQGIQPEQAAMMKQMGMDKIISIVRPDKKLTTVIYPGMQACLNMPMPKEQAELAEATAKVDKTALGKETVDGHPCEKNKFTITDSNGKTTEALVWNASDLKDFPVQVQMKEKNDTVILLYKNVQFTKPAATQFDTPTGYTVYNNMQEFSAGMMQKMMGASAGAATQQKADLQTPARSPRSGSLQGGMSVAESAALIGVQLPKGKSKSYYITEIKSGIKEIDANYELTATDEAIVSNVAAGLAR